MLLPIAGFFLVGVPGFILAVWFSWFARLCWIRGGLPRVAGVWFLTVTSIAGAIALIGAAAASHGGHSALYSFFVFFVVLAIAGGIPSGVIAAIVSLLAHRAPDRVILTIVVGTLCGLASSILGLNLALLVEEVLW